MNQTVTFRGETYTSDEPLDLVLELARQNNRDVRLKCSNNGYWQCLIGNEDAFYANYRQTAWEAIVEAVERYEREEEGEES